MFHFEKKLSHVMHYMRIADFCVVAKRCQQVVKDRERYFWISSKVRRGYSDGGVITIVVLISPAYCGVSQ